MVTLAMEPLGVQQETIVRRLRNADMTREKVEAALRALGKRGMLVEEDGFYLPTALGHSALRETYATLERAQDVSPSSEDMEECPSVPWLTQVQTVWMEALSLNYAVDPAALSRGCCPRRWSRSCTGAPRGCRC